MIRGIIAAAAIVFFGVEAANTGLFAQFSSGVQLIEVYATVTDEKGELVTGLRESDFQVFENDRPQEISAFAAGEFPLTVALGVDRSFSMAGEPLRLAKLASQTFLLLFEPRRIVSFPRNALAAIEFENPTRNVVEKISIVRDGDDRAGVAL